MSGVSEGGRNSSLARLVGSFIYHFGADDVLTFALSVNSRYLPPLPDEEVFSIVKSISDKHQNIRSVSSASLRKTLETDEKMSSFSSLGSDGVQKSSADGFVPSQVCEGVFCPWNEKIKRTIRDGFVPFHQIPPYSDEMERIYEEEKERWRPIAITEIMPPSEMTWHVKGYIAKGIITELVAKLNPNASRKNWLLNF